ncbi:hypothetical protein ES703_93595 [subsurface metagenome]
MKKKVWIITFMISFFLMPQHFVVAQTVWSFTGYGTMDFLHYANGNTSMSFTTDTDWVADRIDIITTGAESRSVLEQHVYSDASGTRISRNALYIGPGPGSSIVASSTYYGSKAPNGENNITGISLTGDSYGALIQNGSLEFNATFGGIRESVAVAGSSYNGYSVEQFGFVDADGSGDFTPQVDYGTTESISGDYYSATIATFDFGSVPQPGLDTFHGNCISWATGVGDYSFNVESPAMRLSVNTNFGWVDAISIVDSEPFEVSASFKAN